MKKKGAKRQGKARSDLHFRLLQRRRLRTGDRSVALRFMDLLAVLASVGGGRVVETLSSVVVTMLSSRHSLVSLCLLGLLWHANEPVEGERSADIEDAVSPEDTY
jgi:hypothetical protein